MSHDELTFVRASVDVIAAAVRELSNGGSYSRRKPDIVGAPQYIYESVMSQIEHDIIPPRSFVAEINNATVRPPGFIYANGAIIEECLVNLHGTSNIEHWMPVIKAEGGRYTASHSDFAYGELVVEPAVLLAQNSDVNYGHWIIECLPKIDLIKEIYDLDRLKFVIGYPNPTMDQIYRDSLASLGIDAHQIVQLGDRPICFSQLIYPGPVTNHPWITSPRSIVFLRRLSEAMFSTSERESKPSRIYMPRNQIGRRRLLNESEIWSVLEKHGFVQICPERLTFSEQVLIISNASIVVGNLGGALSNVVFAPNGLSLVAVSTEFMADDFFFDIITQKGGSYISIHGKASDPGLGMQSDFNVDVDVFTAHLEQAIASDEGRLRAERSAK